MPNDTMIAFVPPEDEHLFVKDKINQRLIFYSEHFDYTN